MPRGEMEEKMTINRNVKRAITSGIALVLLVSVCSACIWGVVSVAKNGIATSDTATWGIGTDGLATNGLATNGVATGGIGIATDGVATEGNSTEYDIYAPIKNVLVATGEVTWEEINEKENELPSMPLDFYVENGLGISLDILLKTPEYLHGKLDYLFEDSSGAEYADIYDVVLETVEAAKNEALARMAALNYYDVSVYSVTEHYVMATNNYSQSTFNKNFNEKYGTEFSGTCCEVAATSVIEYYYRKGYGGTIGHNDRQTIFNVVLNEAFECGAFPSNEGDMEGTYNYLLKTAISGFYEYYGLKFTGKYYSSSVESRVEDALSSYKPVVGHFYAPNGDGHSMCINGYYDITLKYKFNEDSTSYSYLTWRYYRVNDGWRDGFSSDSSQTGPRLQYIFEDYLDAMTRIS